MEQRFSLINNFLVGARRSLAKFVGGQQSEKCMGLKN